jgi:hypothetical protein
MYCCELVLPRENRETKRINEIRRMPMLKKELEDKDV